MTDPTPNLKAQRALASRHTLIASARRLFERQGYGATSTEQLLAQTGLTRGALYHHFKDKQALFEAVCDGVHAELVEAIESATRGVDDAAEALHRGAHAWLQAAADPHRAQVLLVDAPSVLGTRAWLEADRRHGFAALRAGLAATLGPEAHDDRLEALAVALNGAMNELARWVAGDAARLPLALHAIDELVDGAATAGRRRSGGAAP